MATLRQKKLAKNLVDNLQAVKPLNKQELVVSSGYSQISAESSAKNIIEQKGVQKELKALGFDEDTAKRVVAEILENPLEEGSTRLRAASEIFKVFGTYAAEKSFNMTANITAEELSNVIKADLAKFRPHKWGKRAMFKAPFAF